VKSRFAINKRKMEEKKKEYDFDQRMAELKEEEERQKEFKKQKKVREEK
jgi:U4/U6.U5 tri-snRNP component SNU23